MAQSDQAQRAIDAPPHDNSRLARHVSGLLEKYTLNNKVLLVQAPQFLFDTFNADIVKSGGAYAYPPVGLQFVKSALEARGFAVDIFDLNYELLKRTIEDSDFHLETWTEVLDKRLGEGDWTQFGVTCTCVPGHPSDANYFFSDIMRRIMALGRGIVVAGGSIATKHNAYFLQNDLCHFVVSGEGERKSEWLFDLLHRRDDTVAAQGGIFFKDPNGVAASEGGIDGELSSSVRDTYKDIPLEQYWGLGCLNPFSKMAGRRLGEQGARFATIQLNRGCRANCKFCGVYEFMGKGVRQRETDNVIDEIRYLVAQRGARHIDILDDDFLGISRQRQGLVEVLAEIADLRTEYGVTWAAGNGLVAASLDEELLELMDRAGCVGFRMGIESGNDEMMKFLRRPSSKKAVRRAAQMLQRHPDIFVSGNYIIGFFGTETFAEIMDTYRFSGELNLDWAGFSVFQFTSKLEAENQAPGETSTNDFVPTKDHWLRLIEGEGDILSGPAVFSIAPDTVPSAGQIKEIWFAFNLLANYVGNKNLRPDGRPDKLASWIDSVYLSYPGNAYMPLFSGMAHVLMGDGAEAMKRLGEARGNLEKSAYWRWRFEEFALMDLIDSFPATADAVHARLDALSRTYPDAGPGGRAPLVAAGE